MKEDKVKILILGASGMLGNALIKYFTLQKRYKVTGLVRSEKAISLFPEDQKKYLISGFDVQNFPKLENYLAKNRPDVLINCIGVVKQLEVSNDPIITLPINSIFPHKLLNLCLTHSIRMIHMSTDCVFSGKKGMYSELDAPDSNDLYGMSKFLGEINNKNAITIRTSIIGHELADSRSLIDWFLNEEGPINGYAGAIFSGLPTIEIARIIDRYILTNKDLSGLYHLSAKPISKYDLLKLVSSTYGKIIEIKKDNSLNINRSLNSDKFKAATGYSPESWPNLIKLMHQYR